MFNRVSVCLDELAPTRGAFLHAREWAERLRVALFLHDPRIPLSANVLAGTAPILELQQREPTDRSLVAVAPNGSRPPSSTPFSRAVESAATEESLLDPGPGAGTLSVFGRSLTNDLREGFLRPSGRKETPRLLCPEEWQPLSRMLVVHEESGADEPFIRAAIRLCDALEARPIVLTVSRSERVALRREEAIRGALIGHGLHCEFAQFAGPDMGAAVLRVASWRRCQVIVLKERSHRSWWPWRGPDMLEQLMARPGSLAFLVLPEEGLPDPITDSERCKAASGSLKPGR
jgi:hypothetical protein